MGIVFSAHVRDNRQFSAAPQAAPASLPKKDQTKRSANFDLTVWKREVFSDIIDRGMADHSSENLRKTGIQMKVSDILAQKIAEIQSRLPVPMKGTDQAGSAFQSLMDASLASMVSDAPVIDAELVDRPRSTNRKYPLVSGSYESFYPRLSQTQIQELMPRIDAAIEAYSEKFNVDPLLVRAVIKQESGFQPFALSTAGAMGLMQLMPDTAKGLGVSDPYNIEENIRGGIQYLSYQLEAFDNDLSLALAAYNAGPNAVRKYGGIPPYQETRNYVKMVLKYYDMYKALE